ncbi:peptidoglycan editing factor PgeF [Desulfopila sp. IMCC35008]|uniref:peptidoglycan editing factor PgeF n=1 Tax=Desulfopila sp. IMCC35008 TaxID=2653858 RepID=UPI0013D0A4A6|nr:peptidoglycan editing factor PgeF [Desulfopila sp. IMCC35008]
MNFHKKGWVSSPAISDIVVLGKLCRYGFFTRHGGVSSGIYESLNFGFDSGDEEHAVLENREIVKEKLGLDTLLLARQVHGKKVYTLDTPLSGDTQVDGYDSLVTNRKGVGLVIQNADCQAILFYDPGKQVIGAAHSGWRGSVANIAAETVSTMEKEYGTNPADLKVVVSPSLGPCCAEFVNYPKEFPAEFQQFIVAENYFDFWQVTRHQVQECGVKRANILISGICTSCSGDYFSYRRACREGDGRTGRNCSVITLD